MEAKDTVMSDKEIGHSAFNLPEYADGALWATDNLRKACQAQAEISFKAGQEWAEQISRAKLTILVAETQGCKNMEEVNKLLNSWIAANDLEPEKVEVYDSVEELLKAMEEGGNR